jgi:UDP-N-acetylglucosamine--N-acetylmuramyl-(pentapeptide) pyrophosphoryl-undecaprenol N-acetylglucosamine transferase
VSTRRVDVIVSTGASVAVPFFVAGRMYGAEGHYLESAARVDGPSITGQVAAVMPKVRCYTQSESWADSRWKFAGSVFDGYAGRDVASPTEPLRVVVALGSMVHPMDRAVANLNAVLPADAEVVWQLGHTQAIDGMRATRIEQFVSHDELSQLMSDAHVVVCHAGVGSVLQAINAGRSPIVVARQPEHGEHVDDHQSQIAGQLADRGLATAATPESLTTEMLLDVARRGVHRAHASSPLQLRSLRLAGRSTSRQPTVAIPRTLSMSEPIVQRHG